MDHIIVKITPRDPAFCDGCCLLRGIMVAECTAGFQPEPQERHTVRPQRCRDEILAATSLAESEALRHVMDETFAVMQRSWQEQLAAHRVLVDQLHDDIRALTVERDQLRHDYREAKRLLCHFEQGGAPPRCIQCPGCGRPQPVQLGLDGQWYDGPACCCTDQEAPCTT